MTTKDAYQYGSNLDWLVDAAEGGHARSQELLSYIALTSVAKSSVMGPSMASSSSLSLNGAVAPSCSLQRLADSTSASLQLHVHDEDYDKYEDKTEPSLSSLPSVTFVTSGMARVWAACDGGGIPITRKPIFRHPSSPNGNKDEFETSSPILPAGATFSFDALMVQVVEHDDAKIAVTFYHIGSSSSKMMSSLSNASSLSSSTSTAFSLSSSSSLGPDEHPVGWVHNFSFAFPGLMSVTPDLDFEGSSGLSDAAWRSIAAHTPGLSGRFSPDECQAAWSRLWSKLPPPTLAQLHNLAPATAVPHVSSLAAKDPLLALYQFHLKN